MPVPRLLKKLSLKSLRKRTNSTSSAGPDGSKTPKSAASDASFGFGEVVPPPVPPLPNGSYLHSNGSYVSTIPPTPKTPSGTASRGLNGAPSYPPPPTLPPIPIVSVNGTAMPQDDLSRDLQAAWKSASTDPKASKADKALQKIENSASGLMAREAKGATVVVAVKTTLDAVGGVEAIEQGLNAFMEGMPVLMNALDEVAKLHPFIGVAVMAFKAVWALEQKRRDNDKKILMLHMEMKDMMGVLTQLKSVKDPDGTAPDGSSISGRMGTLAKSTADDIKACANVKVLKGPVWEGKLAGFAATFTKRRTEFEFALSIHTALGVDAANRAISTVDATTQAMNEKLDSMMKMFAQLVSPEQREMARLVEQKGGVAVLNNDKALEELNNFENKSSGSQGAGVLGGKGAISKPFDLTDLKDELHADIGEALEQNLGKFARNFELQQRQLADEINRTVERQGDRIIAAVTAGPGDKIIDPNVHAIWKEMGWRGSVKTRHFVMAIRDHFQEETKHSHEQDRNEPQSREPAPRSVEKADEWALEYINVVRLQPISEAFDDDASGFVTVAEVNAFTTARPLDWSLPRWLAYWAIGHHQTIQMYADKIKELLAKLFAILPFILPANRSAAHKYLMTIYQRVYSLAASPAPCYINSALQEKFQSYVQSEEERIRGNLEAVQYDIDANSTLELVTGEGRIDRYVLPVLYLILQRHFEIFRVMQTHVVHVDELWDAGDTLQWVFSAADERLELLRSIFKQQKVEIQQGLKTFSFGLYEAMNDYELFWAAKTVQEAEFIEYTYDESIEKQDIDASKILNYPMDQEPLDFAAYAIPTVVVNQVSEALPDVADQGMLSLTLVPTSHQGEVQYFNATERADRADFKIAGECRVGQEPGTVEFKFKRSFAARSAPEYYSGTWSAATDTLAGTYGFSEDAATHYSVFVFKRMPPENMCAFPLPAELEANRARALWGFAIEATRYKVRRDQWTWSFFKERRDNRRRFIELYIRGNDDTTFGRRLNSEEYCEFAELKKKLTAADSRMYHSLAEREIRAMIDHNAFCDSCGGSIGGARISCLVCQMKDSFNTVDFDDSPECIADRVMRDDMQKPHLPHHDLMKVRRVVHIRQFGQTYRDAKDALKHARTFFEKSSVAGGDAARLDAESDVDTEDEEGHAPVSARRPALAISIPQVPGPSRSAPSAHPLSAISASRSQAPDVTPSGPVCCNCKKTVVQPCWYCVQCGDATFICWDCDAKGPVSFGDHDFHMHDLVRVQELVEEKDLTIEERLMELETRFGKHEKNMDERLDRVEAAVNGRMTKVEQLLEQVLLEFKRQ